MATIIHLNEDGFHHDKALELLNALSSLTGEKPILNNTQLMDSTGKIWYGYHSDHSSFWISPGSGDEPYRIARQIDPVAMGEVKHDVSNRATTSITGSKLHVAWCKCGFSASAPTKKEVDSKFQDHYEYEGE